MDKLPKILPGYYMGQSIYIGPNGTNPIANGYSSGSLTRPFDYSEKHKQQFCAIAPSYQSVVLVKNLR